MQFLSATRNILLLLVCGLLETALVASSDAGPPPGIFGGGDNAAIARWLVQESLWGTFNAPFPWSVSSKEQQQLQSQSDANISGTIIPFAQDSGRIYLYLMGQHNSDKGISLTTSQAALNSDLFGFAGCGMTTDAAVDAQDPRCAKLTLTGSLVPLNDGDSDDGLDALLKSHPNMKEWPEDHDFRVHELTLEDIWMISGFGGGGNIALDEYFAAKPVKQHDIDMMGAAMPEDLSKKMDHHGSAPGSSESKGAARARWIVHNSLWTTVSTISSSSSSEDDSHDTAVAFGNIRSIVDGSDPTRSTGKPIFYLPTPDPTSKDISQNSEIALTFSEAAFGIEKSDCGNDPSSLECGQVILRGKAVKVEDEDDIMNAFAAMHPLAPWLSSGDGSHTGGDYYTIGDLEQVTLVFHFGSSTDIKPEDYLEYQFTNKNDHDHHHHHSNNTQDQHHEENEYYRYDKYDRIDMCFSWISGLLIGVLATTGFVIHRRQHSKYNQIAMASTEMQQEPKYEDKPNGFTA